MNRLENVKTGLAMVLGYTMMNALTADVETTIGRPKLYHPLGIYVCIIMLVYSGTASWEAGIAVVIVYELLKSAWNQLNIPDPLEGELRKLLYRLKTGEPLSDRDIQFLERITPSDVHVTRRS